jgi:hypothetical protein
MAVIYSKWPPNSFHAKALPKFTQIWIFWFENIASGNPDGHLEMMLLLPSREVISSQQTPVPPSSSWHKLDLQGSEASFEFAPRGEVCP